MTDNNKTEQVKSKLLIPKVSITSQFMLILFTLAASGIITALTALASGGKFIHGVLPWGNILLVLSFVLVISAAVVTTDLRKFARNRIAASERVADIVMEKYGIEIYNRRSLVTKSGESDSMIEQIPVKGRTRDGEDIMLRLSLSADRKDVNAYILSEPPRL